MWFYLTPREVVLVPPSSFFSTPPVPSRGHFRNYVLCFFQRPKIEPSTRKSELRGRPKSHQSPARLPKSVQNKAPCAPRGLFSWFRRTSVFEQHDGLTTFTWFTGSPGSSKRHLRTNVATDRLFCLSGLCKKRPMVPPLRFCYENVSKCGPQ